MVCKTCTFPSKGFQPGVLSPCPTPFKPESPELPQLQLALELTGLLRLRAGFFFFFFSLSLKLVPSPGSRGQSTSTRLVQKKKKIDLVWQEGRREVLINVFVAQCCRLAQTTSFWAESFWSASTCVTWWSHTLPTPFWRKGLKAWKGEEARLRKTIGKKFLKIACCQTTR